MNKQTASRYESYFHLFSQLNGASHCLGYYVDTPRTSLLSFVTPLFMREFGIVDQEVFERSVSIGAMSIDGSESFCIFAHSGEYVSLKTIDLLLRHTVREDRVFLEVQDYQEREMMALISRHSGLVRRKLVTKKLLANLWRSRFI